MTQCDPCLMQKLMYFWFVTKYLTPQHFTMSKISGCPKFGNIGIMHPLFYVDVKTTSGAIPRSYPASVSYRIFNIFKKSRRVPSKNFRMIFWKLNFSIFPN